MTAQEALKNMNDEYNELLERFNLTGGFGNWYIVVKKALEHAKKEHKLLGLYQRFVNEFEFQIITENNSNDYENWVEEYLDQSGATDNSIILLRKIKVLEEELK